MNYHYELKINTLFFKWSRFKLIIIMNKSIINYQLKSYISLFQVRVNKLIINYELTTYTQFP